jgi:GNAT superfamily N-acetyltransferase
MTPTIRRATQADTPVLFEIRTSVRENHMTLAELAAEGVTPASIEAWLASGSAAWLGFVDDVASGFAMARRDQRDLFALFVRPEAEHAGLGSALLRQAEAWLAAEGIEQPWLLTGGEAGLAAPRFYEAHGWTLVERMDNGDLHYTKRLIWPAWA